MKIQEGWVDNRGVRIHYLDTLGPEISSEQVPVVIVPGALHAAEDYLEAAKLMASRRVIVLSLRGRGKSDAPETGYSFQEHVTDIEAVIGNTDLDGFCLMAYSLGVPYAIGYAARHPQRLVGFIIGDFPAYYPALPPRWEEKAALGAEKHTKLHVIQALQRESSEVLLWDNLEKIECPALIMRGGQPGSMLTAAECKLYQRHLREATVEVFEDSGHALWEPDYAKFVGTLSTFIGRVDERYREIRETSISQVESHKV